MSNDGEARGEKRKPLRVVITEIDQEILRLLVRRHNLLAKMRRNGHLDPGEEKFLREAWQNDVARVSRDADLSGRFFSLMQQVSFLPKPEGEKAPREAFNLAPSRQPVRISLAVPVSWWETCAWLFMAASAGTPLRIGHSLQNDTIVDCIRGLVQMGGAITREANAIIVRPGAPLEAPDKVVFVGDNEFVFYLFTAHYLGVHGRVKLSGATDLQIADHSALSRLMPHFGARMVHITPRSSGLPVRLESSGMLPSGFDAPPDCPAGFLEALLLAAPFYRTPFAVNLGDHPQKTSILARVLPILQTCGATYAFSGNTVSLEPGALSIPEKPKLAAEPALSAFLLAFASVLGGETLLEGNWPAWPETDNLWQMCKMVHWQKQKNAMSCNAAEGLKEFSPVESGPGPRWEFPLLASLAACAALHAGRGAVLPAMAADASTQDFLRVVGLAVNEDNILVSTGRHTPMAWNAPTAEWAMAYALAACARPGLPLGNPGVMTALWPHFWQFYNRLPTPEMRAPSAPENGDAPKKRRRILTNIVAAPPDLPENDRDA